MLLIDLVTLTTTVQKHIQWTSRIELDIPLREFYQLRIQNLSDGYQLQEWGY